MAANERSQKQSSVSKRNNKKSIDGKRSASRDTESNTYVSKAKEPVPTRSQAGITRASEAPKKTTKRNPISRAASAVKTAVRKLTGRKKSEDTQSAAPVQTARGKKVGTAKAARVARRDGDIGIERIESTYTPPQTSLKAGFRATGADRQHDQEFVRGVADDRWNDEDLLTNKSGDSRIGTHGRTYEPGESPKKGS